MSIFAKPDTYWIKPGSNILQATDSTSTADCKVYDIQYTLSQIGIHCISIQACVGASVVTYHIDLISPMQYTKLQRSLQVLSAMMHANVTLETSQVAHCAIVVPRTDRQTVHWSQHINTHTFAALDRGTACLLGQSAGGATVAIDLRKQPHLLIAGATGSGKSVMLHSILSGMLFGSPADIQFVMIDPKQVELTQYDGIPHLARPVITDVPRAIATLRDVCATMDERYKTMRAGGVAGTPIAIVIDELADLIMTSGKMVEPMIVRIAQLGRAAGIHLIIATQRPTVNVVTGLIKANIPARIALTMAGTRDATVVEVPGANKLSGKGDALYQSPDHTQSPTRLQGAFVRPGDIQAMVGHWRRYNRPVTLREAQRLGYA